MTGGRRDLALRTILELAEAGYFADFEVLDEVQALGVSAGEGEQTLDFAADVGLVTSQGPIRLTAYGSEILSSAEELGELTARLERPRPAPDSEERVLLPRNITEWRRFRSENPAAAAAVARGLLVPTAEVFFRVRSGSEDVFASRFEQRVGRVPDPGFVREAPSFTARVAEGFVRWQGNGEILGVLLELAIGTEDEMCAVAGEFAWQLAEEGWQPSPPHPIEAINERMGRLGRWFSSGVELARSGT